MKDNLVKQALRSGGVSIFSEGGVGSGFRAGACGVDPASPASPTSISTSKANPR